MGWLCAEQVAIMFLFLLLLRLKPGGGGGGGGKCVLAHMREHGGAVGPGSFFARALSHLSA